MEGWAGLQSGSLDGYPRNGMCRRLSRRLGDRQAFMERTYETTLHDGSTHFGARKQDAPTIFFLSAHVPASRTPCPRDFEAFLLRLLCLLAEDTTFCVIATDVHRTQPYHTQLPFHLPSFHRPNSSQDRSFGVSLSAMS